MVPRNGNHTPGAGSAQMNPALRTRSHSRSATTQQRYDRMGWSAPGTRCSEETHPPNARMKVLNPAGQSNARFAADSGWHTPQIKHTVADTKSSRLTTNPAEHPVVALRQTISRASHDTNTESSVHSRLS